jgi:anti-sigma regulatory factor (Ser/Thr protein kinase)/CheY-like chemotaxis protein
MKPSSPAGVVRTGPREVQFPAIANALREVRAFVSELAGAAGITGDDLDKILLVVNEAATNAVEHSGGHVVRVLWEDHDQGVRVTVEDDGVFDLRGRPGGDGGYGLKLAFGLADEVQVRAGRPGAPGTMVRLHIRTHARAGVGPAGTGAGRQRLLLVDGDRFSGRSLASFLEAEGYEVTLAASVEAGRAALSFPPHLMIVDLMTSNGRAGQLCAEIKQRSTAPVVALSLLRPRALPQGADRFVRKPAHPLEVLTAVRQLLAQPVPDVAPEASRG